MRRKDEVILTEEKIAELAYYFFMISELQWRTVRHLDQTAKAFGVSSDDVLEALMMYWSKRYWSAVSAEKLR